MTIGYSQNYPWGNPTDFETKIKGDIKIHTIREDKTKRWKAGSIIHHVYGSRTKQRRQFELGKCVSVQRFDLSWNGGHMPNEVTIKVDGRELYEKEKLLLAQNDGFSSMFDFLRWFSNDVENYTLIHWTDLKY